VNSSSSNNAGNSGHLFDVGVLCEWQEGKKPSGFEPEKVNPAKVNTHADARSS